LDEENSLHSERLPGRDERVGEVLGRRQMTAAEKARRHDHRQPPSDRREGPEIRGGAHEVRLLGRRAGDADGVRHEDADEDDGVEKRDRALQRQRQRVETGDGEVGDSPPSSYAPA